MEDLREEKRKQLEEDINNYVKNTINTFTDVNDILKQNFKEKEIIDFIIVYLCDLYDENLLDDVLESVFRFKNITETSLKL